MPHHRYSCDLDVFIGKGWEQAAVDWEAFGAKCKAFRFDRFVP